MTASKLRNTYCLHHPANFICLLEFARLWLVGGQMELDYLLGAFDQRDRDNTSDD
jgi:hypothetical protein